MDCAELLARFRADALVSANAGDVAWLTGFAVPHESWPSPLRVPTVVVAERGGDVTLVVPELFAGLGTAADGVHVERYATYGLAEGLPLHGSLAEVVAAVVGARGLRGASLVVDAGLPLAVARALEHCRLTPVEDPTIELRMRKTGAEIERIRASARACDLFQRAVRDEARPGRTEAELFAAARRRVEAQAGRRVTVLGDLVSGTRTVEGGGPPGDRVLDAGDAVLCDVAISLDGYWADNCSTVAAGEPTVAHARAARVVREALELAIEQCRPGVRAGAVDDAVRNFLGGHGYGWGHHLGHGVGASYHELPRLVPGAQQRLEESMVVCLEPAALTGTPVGVRHEVVGVIRADGFECVSAMPELP
jgi:Xaa-Pro dipeptidase